MLINPPLSCVCMGTAVQSTATAVKEIMLRHDYPQSFQSWQVLHSWTNHKVVATTISAELAQCMACW